MIIGITGNIGSGKDTIAKMIQYYFAAKNLPSGFGIKTMPEMDDFLICYDEWMFEKRFKNNTWQIKKFAQKLKQCSALILGCSEQDFESEEFKNSILPDRFQQTTQNDLFEESGLNKKTYRWFLQTFGTEVGRSIQKDIWVNSLFSEYMAINVEKRADIGGAIDYSDCNFPNWIISDLRFLNEAKAIKDRNGIIIKVKRGLESTETHISEIELHKIIPDYEINNNGNIEELYKSVSTILNEITQNYSD